MDQMQRLRSTGSLPDHPPLFPLWTWWVESRRQVGQGRGRRKTCWSSRVLQAVTSLPCVMVRLQKDYD